MMSGAAAITSCADTMRSLAFFANESFGKDFDAAGDLDQLRYPAQTGDHRDRPIPRNKRADGVPAAPLVARTCSIRLLQGSG